MIEPSNLLNDFVIPSEARDLQSAAQPRFPTLCGKRFDTSDSNIDRAKHVNLDAPYKNLHTLVKPGITMAASHVLTCLKNCLFGEQQNMRRFLKTLPVALSLLALAAVSIFAISCSSNNSVQARLVNAIYNTSSYGGGLDVEVNGTKDFTAIAFPSASGSTYKPLPAGNDTFLGLQENSSTQVFQNNATLSGGTQYTLVAAGQSQGQQGTVVFSSFADNNTAPAAGYVNFRIINASDAESAVDVYIEQTPFTGSIGSQNGNPPQISNLGQNAASGYKTLPWNSDSQGWTIYVTPAGSTLIILNGFNTGNFGGTGTEAIRTLILTDEANTNNSMSSVPIVLSDLN
jgi:hypothetical protein